MSDSQTERVPTPRDLRVPTPRRPNERTNRRRGWIDSRATSWRTCQPSFAGRTWRNPPSSLCKRNSRPSSGWGCRRRKTLSGNRCAHEFPNPNPRLCAFLGGVASKFFRMNATRDTTDGYAFATMYRSIHWRRRRRRRRRARTTTPSSVVAAFIREENQFLPFEPCASFPYTECSCELCGIWILPATEPTPVGRRVRRTRVADIRMDD